jgi:hypothetical protein
MRRLLSRGGAWAIGGGLLLDLLDLATPGPVGLELGLPLGAVAGWLLASRGRAQGGAHLLLALLAAVYCMLPGTEPLPLATAASVVLRLLGGGAQGGDPPAPRADYTSSWVERAVDEAPGAAGRRELG